MDNTEEEMKSSAIVDGDLWIIDADKKARFETLKAKIV